MTFPHTATLQRKNKNGTTYLFGSNGTTVCFLQPLQDQETQLFGITMGKGFRCYIPYETDAIEGDRLVIDSVTYGVKGLKVHNYGTIRHKRLLLETI